MLNNSKSNIFNAEAVSTDIKKLAQQMKILKFTLLTLLLLLSCSKEELTHKGIVMSEDPNVIIDGNNVFLKEADTRFYRVTFEVIHSSTKTTGGSSSEATFEIKNNKIKSVGYGKAGYGVFFQEQHDGSLEVVYPQKLRDGTMFFYTFKIKKKETNKFK